MLSDRIFLMLEYGAYQWEIIWIALAMMRNIGMMIKPFLDADPVVYGPLADAAIDGFYWAFAESEYFLRDYLGEWVSR